MLGFSYFKAEPTDHILAYRNGKLIRQGAGRSFWYWRADTSIASIPTSTIDALFVLNETTNNFQTVTVQGQITYRIAEPQTSASLLDFTIDPQSREYRTDDPEKLKQRVINVVQAKTRAELQQMTLEDTLRSSERLSQTVLEHVQQDATLIGLGVACLSLFFTAIRATPELTKALEAEYREALQKRADQAIYTRRADAVEQERKIKQNELSTSIDLEQRRQELIALQGENMQREAATMAETTRIQFEPYATLDSRMLLALAFRDFALNASKIGNLTISSEILEQLLHGK